jgi:lipoic acid synthetase
MSPLSPRKRLPPWMRMKMPGDARYMEVKAMVDSHRLHTICTSGNCPNISECWAAGTATFMILGEICTRSCKFCAVATGRPGPVDADEPYRLADSIMKMGITHAVITSVDRDDLNDGGAEVWANTIKVLHGRIRGLTMEALIPDFDGKPELVQQVIDAGPDVISHNLETVKRLTPLIRTKARYETSLSVIRQVAASGITAKSGIMLGLGEREDEVLKVMDDLLEAGCSVFTLGQYLQPTMSHMPVEEYITPEKFEEYRKIALKKGFRQVESSPLVRSSYHAARHAPPKLGFEDLGLIDYKLAWDYQEQLFERWQKYKLNGQTGISPGHRLLFCEHPHVYTLGKSGDENNMLIQKDFLEKINAGYYRINRGGDITYHGPGQIVGYPIIDLEEFGLGLKSYIELLEEAVIKLLTGYGIKGERMKGVTGVWLESSHPVNARKICAIGVRSARYVTMHGFALNVNTNLDYFNYINPCGLQTKGVTSMQKELKRELPMEEVKSELKGILMKMLR